jgi:hypothetical protein
MRYLASVVTQSFTAFGELLALHKRFAELSGGVTRVAELLQALRKAQQLQAGLQHQALDSAAPDSAAAGARPAAESRPALRPLARLSVRTFRGRRPPARAPRQAWPTRSSLTAWTW